MRQARNTEKLTGAILQLPENAVLEALNLNMR